MIYSIAFKAHVYLSAITMLSGILTLVLSIRGWINRNQYTRLDEWSSLIFNIGLYMQLILGLVIYLTFRTSLEGAMWEIPEPDNKASLRFWAIEHISLMIFALFLSQLGRMFIRQTVLPLRKFKASVFYNGIALLVILFSLSIAVAFEISPGR